MVKKEQCDWFVTCTLLKGVCTKLDSYLRVCHGRVSHPFRVSTTRPEHQRKLVTTHCLSSSNIPPHHRCLTPSAPTPEPLYPCSPTTPWYISAFVGESPLHFSKAHQRMYTSSLPLHSSPAYLFLTNATV